MDSLGVKRGARAWNTSRGATMRAGAGERRTATSGVWTTAIAAAAAAAAIAVAGCGPPGADETDAGPETTLLVSWTFADGRDCEEAGVPTVRIRLGRANGASSSAVYACALGWQQAVPAPPVRAGRWELSVEARSGAGATVYAAGASLDLDAPLALPGDVVVAVSLVFTGGASR